MAIDVLFERTWSVGWMLEQNDQVWLTFDILEKAMQQLVWTDFTLTGERHGVKGTLDVHDHTSHSISPSFAMPTSTAASGIRHLNR